MESSLLVHFSFFISGFTILTSPILGIIARFINGNSRVAIILCVVLSKHFSLSVDVLAVKSAFSECKSEQLTAAWVLALVKGDHVFVRKEFSEAFPLD